MADRDFDLDQRQYIAVEARGRTEKCFLEKTSRQQEDEQQETGVDFVWSRWSHQSIGRRREIDVNAGRDRVEGARQRATRDCARIEVEAKFGIVVPLATITSRSVKQMVWIFDSASSSSGRGSGNSGHERSVMCASQ